MEKKRNGIRVVDVPDKTFEKIKKKAKAEKRTLSKQALVEIEKGLKQP